ncbi:hypothetical protein AFK24_09245 [Pseudomonas syringae]|uniref:Uncharacterized protein n=1 Tax=Pseudomonas syringae TaxID=317 RepID=A0A1C7Z869_PSESX|nr:hypothetical protein [Pseudomonas syringae]OCR25246.1 hypothetical protein AFK24_09245 [Pseudomonas syringae]
MIAGLTEEEMRQALFGPAGVPALSSVQQAQEEPTTIAVIPPQAVAKGTPRKSRIPRMKVTLRVGNEFEGETEMFIHEADTLSTLQAELEATKAARKKFKYIEVISVKPAR